MTRNIFGNRLETKTAFKEFCELILAPVVLKRMQTAVSCDPLIMT